MTTARSATPTTPHDGPRMLRLLAGYLAPQRGLAAVMSLLLLASIGLQLLVPQLLGDFIDGVSGGAPASQSTHTALLFLAVALAQQVLGAGATYAGAAVGWTATNLLRRDLARHTLGLDLGFHNARTPGEMIERLDGDVTALSNFFSQFSVRVLGGAMLLLGILVVLWSDSPFLGAALTVFVLLELAVLSRTRRAGVPATHLEREASARLFGVIEERVSGLDDLRANGAGAYALHRFGLVARRFYRDTRRAWMLRSIVWLSSYGLFILGVFVTLGSAIVLVRRGSLTVGGAYTVFQYMLMLQNPIEQITQQLQELQKAAAGVGRIGELMGTASSLSAGGSAPLPTGALCVRFDGVTFHYGDGRHDQPTLRGVDLRLEAGRRLGLLGRTGSGKTTLTRLLFRLYDPTAGRVLVGGVDARDVDLQELRGRVGLVTQEVQLFRGSLRDNLTFFDPSVPDERVVGVLEQLGLGPWLASLPDGLATPVDAGGRNLSAGEGQLIAFARVFLKDPGLVVLDEPSSRLDPITERRLHVALERLLHGRTAIIIAHRLETVERVDDILVLEGGGVAEHGSRTRLAADPTSRYARLRRAALRLDLNVAAGVPASAAAQAERGSAGDARATVPGLEHALVVDPDRVDDAELLEELR